MSSTNVSWWECLVICPDCKKQHRVYVNGIPDFEAIYEYKCPETGEICGVNELIGMIMDEHMPANPIIAVKRS